MDPEGKRESVLLVRAGGRACAIPLSQVIETLRPLPTTPCAGLPPFVLGGAVVRGAAVPVVELGAFLGVAPAPATRFVLVRCGARPAALAVDSVTGVASIAGGDRTATPLLGAADGGAIEALGALDGELLVLLRAARIVPDGAWRAITGQEDVA
ncbi:MULTISPECIES: chemotaxis protein CheW [Anaeromyxobacter]|uniref:chemotaxis protein CheW n=1 Tax=Anaeromyxobacter TaxID=161492 RepID=UPI001F597926|nr:MULTISPECIES: chemotaxis protein CheW [unclassified Anaeromyxobacter]